ncbi:MAG: serine acetyltransferase [Acidobacteria bacterium]|nr:serine acetyltransferase [Acidobacteriota bacterium]
MSPAGRRPSSRGRGRKRPTFGVARDAVTRSAAALVRTYGSEVPAAHNLDLVGRLPSPERTVAILEKLVEVLYPGIHGNPHLTRDNVDLHIAALLDDIAAELVEQAGVALHRTCPRGGESCSRCAATAGRTVDLFLAALPRVRRLLTLDIRSAYEGDPAAQSFEEIMLAYPGLRAVTVYRLAHELHRLGVPLLARIMTEHAHRETGIDIHPGAEIGKSFFIDHGTGVVIGETTTIGRNVKIYQGVTLGALSIPRDERGNVIRGKKRHPTIEDDVVIYAGATILGGDTVIGKSSVVGGNTWVIQSVPPRSRVISTPQEQRIERKRRRPSR